MAPLLRLPTRQALENVHGDRDRAKWPMRGADSRLEPVCMPVLKPRFHLRPGAKVFTIGSCFARNIEEHLAARGFDVPMQRFTVPREEWPGRPSGILNKYHAPSFQHEVALTAELLDLPEPAQAERIAELLLPVGEDQVVDLQLAGFRPVSRARAMERRAAVLEVFRHAFEAEVVVLTLGMAEAWFDHQTGRYIQQAPIGPMFRRLHDRFEFRLLDFVETLDWSARTMALLASRGRAGKRFMLTVSPVPLQATFTGMDAIVANGYAKSMLRAVAETLAGQREDADYVPSYEAVMLSHDPGVWEDDLVHVTSRFVGRVVGHILEAYAAPAASETGSPATHA
jgi:hypothetical protein